MADKKTNREYYKKNRKYILLRKKLKREGKVIPPIEKIHQDGLVLIVFGDLILAKERHL